ncbi:MAG: acetyl-CoA C-acyltransferase, partial [SAR324 cluster bacterium]|nr:acetyl-CoA C-acyltransferase [SAR324 cluster bacterium]
KRWEISREDQDQLALESHQRAAKAISEGRFKEQIMLLEIKQRKKTLTFDTDEHVRAEATIEDMARLKPVFDPEGTVTAGNSSGINDGAAAVVLMERSLAESRGLRPMARLVSYAVAGVEPEVMGIGPVPAIRECLGKCDLTVGDMDVIELNEAFAAQALAVIREHDLPLEKTNPNGSGISLGHPVGATGCIITIKALYELQRIGGRYALVSMCIGGGQGIAAVFERLG